MKELIAKFDKNISLKDFDKETQKLIRNFPSKKNILIKVLSKTDYIFVSIVENFNKNASERVSWNLSGIEL